MNAALVGEAGADTVTDSEIRRQRFHDLYDRYAGAVLGYALRRVIEPQDAADVCAETFMTAWRRIDDVPPADQALPWLYVVAGNLLSNQLRGQRRQTAVVVKLRNHVTRTMPGPSEPHSGGQDSGPAIADAMDRLSGTDRELLRLTVWEELTPTEVGAVLGLDPGVVRSRLHRARGRLRKAMTELRRPTAVAEPISSSLITERNDHV